MAGTTHERQGIHLNPEAVKTVVADTVMTVLGILSALTGSSSAIGGRYQSPELETAIQDIEAARNEGRIETLGQTFRRVFRISR